jgi:Tfp pilus assembly protein PilE
MSVIEQEKSSKGFSVLELGLVLVILSTLTSVAVPKISVYMARTGQTRAMCMLYHVHTLMEVYRITNSNNYLGAALDETIGWEDPKDDTYALTLKVTSDLTFVAEAISMKILGLSEFLHI